MGHKKLQMNQIMIKDVISASMKGSTVSLFRSWDVKMFHLKRNLSLFMGRLPPFFPRD